MPSIHTSLSGMPFHSFLLKFHGKNAAMGRCDGPRTYMWARWKAIIMAETMVPISLLKGEYIHHARRSAFHEDSMRFLQNCALEGDSTKYDWPQSNYLHGRPKPNP